jgi:hypothetical protein
MPDPGEYQARHELRLRIARARRRMDRHLVAASASGRQLLSWQTYVRRYPGYAVLAALGAGLTLSAGLKRGGWGRRLGARLVTQAGGRIGELVWQELRSWVASLGTATTAESTEANHDGT